MDLLDRALGVPLSKSAREIDYKARREHNADGDTAANIRSGVEHITNKSGALMQADAIFIAFALIGVEQNPLSTLDIVSLILLVLSCLLLVTNLRAVWPRSPLLNDDRQLELVYRLRMARGVKFNIATLLVLRGRHRDSLGRRSLKAARCN
jgi:hypothetical protein